MFIKKPFKAVIVDDSTAMHAFMLSVCAQNKSFETSCFEDGDKALEFIVREKVRLVFVDINMPNMYGDDLLRKCVALKNGIQVYVITGSDSITIADRCLNVGARGIIPKPMLREGCLQALEDTERFFNQWNNAMRYFIDHKKAS